jgi:hypothetical protein
MKKYIFRFLIVFVFMFSLTTQLSFAAKPDHAGGGSKPGGGGSEATPSLIGYDISYPQCGSKRLPSDHAFGIVGVNNGRATEANPCLSDQLRWASRASGALLPDQPKIQLYVNTANPGEVLEQFKVTTWPTNNIDSRDTNSFENSDPAKKNPYGACKETAGAYLKTTNSLACSWQYGWNRSVDTVDNFFSPAVARVSGIPQSAAEYTWWLDVETMNSWQEEADADGAQDPEGLAKNTATLEGMTAFYKSEGVAKVGIYSTSYQWRRITGSTVQNGEIGQNLRSLDSWLAGAGSESSAREMCKLSGLTPGSSVSLVQYLHKNLDHNISCL